MPLLQYLLVGLAAGWIIGRIRTGKGYGLLGNLFVGAIGSLFGWFLMGFLKVEAPTVLAQIAMAVMGAVLFFFLLSLLKRKKRKKKEEDEE